MSSLTIFNIASAARLASPDRGRHHVAENGGDDLPRQTEAVLQPATLLGGPAVEQRIPVAVDLGLVFAIHDERHRMVERIQRSGRHRDEGLAEQNEVDDFHRPGRPARRLTRQRYDASNTRIGKDGGVERAASSAWVEYQRKGVIFCMISPVRQNGSIARVRRPVWRACRQDRMGAQGWHRIVTVSCISCLP